MSSSLTPCLRALSAMTGSPRTVPSYLAATSWRKAGASVMDRAERVEKAGQAATGSLLIARLTATAEDGAKSPSWNLVPIHSGLSTVDSLVRRSPQEVRARPITPNNDQR